MKRIIILQSNKDDIMSQIKRLGLEIEQKASSYIILKQNDILKESIQFIFKSININRPADFYKYKKDDMFFIPNYIYKQQGVKDFFNSFKKSKDINVYSSFEDFLEFLPLDSKTYWYISLPYKDAKIKKGQTLSTKLPKQAFWKKEEAKEELEKILKKEISSIKTNIAFYQNLLSQYETSLDKLKEV